MAHLFEAFNALPRIRHELREGMNWSNLMEKK